MPTVHCFQHKACKRELQHQESISWLIIITIQLWKACIVILSPGFLSLYPWPICLANTILCPKCFSLGQPNKWLGWVTTTWIDLHPMQENSCLVDFCSPDSIGHFSLLTLTWPVTMAMFLPQKWEIQYLSSLLLLWCEHWNKIPLGPGIESYII